MFIGYIGTDSIGSLIKRFAAKKAGVDGREINNQRKKAFLDMLALWSEGTDNGRQKTRNHEVYDVIVGGRAIYWSPITLANLSR